MQITSHMTFEEIHHIASHITQEGDQQANLYGIANIAERLWKDLISAPEFGVFRNSDGEPVACYGVRHGSVDQLFLVVTTMAMGEYRSFSREARKWLSKRLRPIRCTLPRVSTKTLRMIKVWGFYEVPTLKHLDVPSVTMEYKNA